MNLTELEDRAARNRRGKLEMKMGLILLVLILVVVVAIVGSVVG